MLRKPKKNNLYPNVMPNFLFDKFRKKIFFKFYERFLTICWCDLFAKNPLQRQNLVQKKVCCNTNHMLVVLCEYVYHWLCCARSALFCVCIKSQLIFSFTHTNTKRNRSTRLWLCISVHLIHKQRNNTKLSSDQCKCKLKIVIEIANQSDGVNQCMGKLIRFNIHLIITSNVRLYLSVCVCVFAEHETITIQMSTSKSSTQPRVIY